MAVLTILFLLSKTQNYMFLSSLSQQKVIKSYQNFLVNDLKDRCIGMNIKQKVRIKIRQKNITTFSNQDLLDIICFSLYKSRWQC